MRIFVGCLFSMAVVLVLAHPVAHSADNGHEYIGSTKCKKCHIKEYRAWAETKMANAFEALKAGAAKERKLEAGLDPDKDYTTDPECLSCHTVGYGKPGGFVDIATTPDLAGVGCEMCHGAGGNYTQDQFMSLKNKNYKRADIVAAGMVEKVTGERCTGLCHNEKSPFAGEGYAFDFASMREKDAHKNFPLKYEH